jgi:hypothetical protein
VVRFLDEGAKVPRHPEALFGKILLPVRKDQQPLGTKEVRKKIATEMVSRFPNWQFNKATILWACSRGLTEVVDLHLQRGGSLPVEPSDSLSDCLQAALNVLSPVLMGKMISLGADCCESFTLDLMKNTRRTPIPPFAHFAWTKFDNHPRKAWESLVPIAKILVRNGAHMARPPAKAYCSTPLSAALHRGHWPLVEYMCDVGVHLFDWGVSPIEFARNVERIKSFVDLGYKIDTPAFTGKLPIEAALRAYARQDVDLEVVYYFIDNVRDINQKQNGALASMRVSSACVATVDGTSRSLYREWWLGAPILLDIVEEA